MSPTQAEEKLLSRFVEQLSQNFDVNRKASTIRDADTLALLFSDTEENHLVEDSKTVLGETNTIPFDFFEEDTHASDTPKSTAPSPQLLGKYIDLGVLGEGGMGEVRRVKDPVLKRTLAMKIIRNEMLGKNQVVGRFIEEAQIGAQLQHPNIVPVHELRSLPMDVTILR